MAALFGLCYAVSPNQPQAFYPSLRLASPSMPPAIAGLRGGSHMDKWMGDMEDEDKDDDWKQKMEDEKIEELVRDGETFEKATAIVRNETLSGKNDTEIRLKREAEANMTYTELMTK